MRKALVVGINYYARGPRLYGCVQDANSVAAALRTHGDGSPNFNVKLLTASSEDDAVSKKTLKEDIEELFADNNDDAALFYFAGHGAANKVQGYLCTSDSQEDDGVELSFLTDQANRSRASSKLIILDSCHSGAAGTFTDRNIPLEDGMTILTAATKKQYATEEDDRGTFTSLFIDALEGSACNLVGEISPGSIYAHIDKSLGPWKQRPVFRTNVRKFISVRRVQPPIDRSDLSRICEFFPERGSRYRLDPTYEPELAGRPPEAPPPNEEHVRIFAILQKYNRVNLVVPEDAPHMWHAAIESKSCRLTAQGEYYRQLIKEALI